MNYCDGARGSAITLLDKIKWYETADRQMAGWSLRAAFSGRIGRMRHTAQAGRATQWKGHWRSDRGQPIHLNLPGTVARATQGANVANKGVLNWVQHPMWNDCHMVSHKERSRTEAPQRSTFRLRLKVNVNKQICSPSTSVCTNIMTPFRASDKHHTGCCWASHCTLESQYGAFSFCLMWSAMFQIDATCTNLTLHSLWGKSA